MDKPGWNPWFVVAWVFLVIITSFALWRQSQLIDQVEEQADRLRLLVAMDKTETIRAQQALCQLFLDITNEEVHPRVEQAFHNLSIRCSD